MLLVFATLLLSEATCPLRVHLVFSYQTFPFSKQPHSVTHSVTHSIAAWLSGFPVETAIIQT